MSTASSTVVRLCCVPTDSTLESALECSSDLQTGVDLKAKLKRRRGCKLKLRMLFLRGNRRREGVPRQTISRVGKQGLAGSLQVALSRTDSTDGLDMSHLNLLSCCSFPECRTALMCKFACTVTIAMLSLPVKKSVKQKPRALPIALLAPYWQLRSSTVLLLANIQEPASLLISCSHFRWVCKLLCRLTQSQSIGRQADVP